jgi:hypothetical protein
MQNKDLAFLDKILNISLIGIPGLMLTRIILKYSSMGWFNFLFSSTLLAGTSMLSRFWFFMSKDLVKEVYLMEDGKHVRFVTFGLLEKKKDVKIKDIVNPEENNINKMRMMHFGLWIVQTVNNDSFYIFPNSESFYKDALKEILKGNEIEIGEQSNSKENIIDI